MKARQLKVACLAIAIVSVALAAIVPAVSAVSSAAVCRTASTPQVGPAPQVTQSVAWRQAIVPPPQINSNPSIPSAQYDDDFGQAATTPRKLENYATIAVIVNTNNKNPNNPAAVTTPPPSGTGNPWKPVKEEQNDITIKVSTKGGQDFNNTANAGVWFKCWYTLWDGTSGYYKLRMDVAGNTATIVLGKDTYSQFLVIAGTKVQWFINATCDAWTPDKTLISGGADGMSDYVWTVGGIWAAKDFNANLKMDLSTTSPIIGEEVTVTVSAKDPKLAQIRVVILAVNVTYPTTPKTYDSFETAMAVNGNDTDAKTYTIPGDYQTRADTEVKLSCIVWVYAGYSWYYYISSPAAIKSYKVSKAGLFPEGKIFEEALTVSTSPDVIFNKVCNHSTSVRVTLESNVDGTGLPVPFFGQIFYFINVTDQPSLSGIDAMNDISKTKKYFDLPSVAPASVVTEVTFWCKATDNNGRTLTSLQYKYIVEPIQVIVDPDNPTTIIFIVVYDYWQKTGVAKAPVRITGTDFSLESQTTDMGTLVPHEPGNPSVIHRLSLNHTYIINVTFPTNGQTSEASLYLEQFPQPGTKVLSGRDYKGDKSKNWSVILDIDKTGIRTLRFVFNYFSSKQLIFAEVVKFPNDYIEFIAYATVIILLAPVVVMLDKRRKKAEEDEKRVTL